MTTDSTSPEPIDEVRRFQIRGRMRTTLGEICLGLFLFVLCGAWAAVKRPDFNSVTLGLAAGSCLAWATLSLRELYRLTRLLRKLPKS